MDERHFDTRRAPLLDREERLREIRPGDLLRGPGGIRPGMTCVDLGCGTGAFSLPMAEYVGDGGTVYAVDDSAEMLDRVRAKRPPSNLRPVHSDAGRTGLDDEIADFCLLAFILHEMGQPMDLVAEAFRLTKPGGRVMAVEWRPELESPGPPRRIRLSAVRLDGLFTEAGFSDLDHAVWSPNHYWAVGSKPTPD